MLMAVCDLLNTYSVANIGRALMAYSRDENADKFIDKFINKQGIPKTTRYKLNSLDPKDDIEKSIIGFDNIALSKFVEPKLTTIDQNMFLLGTNAATLLLEKIESDNSYSKRIILINSLIERDTVAPLKKKQQKLKY